MTSTPRLNTDIRVQHADRSLEYAIESTLDVAAYNLSRAHVEATLALVNEQARLAEAIERIADAIDAFVAGATS